MKTFIQVRSEIFMELVYCPVCCAPIVSAEKSDMLETAVFFCGAAFYLQTGGTPAVSNNCPTPSQVAILGLEDDARKAMAS